MAYLNRAQHRLGSSAGRHTSGALTPKRDPEPGPADQGIRRIRFVRARSTDKGEGQFWTRGWGLCPVDPSAAQTPTPFPSMPSSRTQPMELPLFRTHTQSVGSLERTCPSLWICCVFHPPFHMCQFGAHGGCADPTCNWIHILLRCRMRLRCCYPNART